jgi:hypothetical protein
MSDSDPDPSETPMPKRSRPRAARPQRLVEAGAAGNDTLAQMQQWMIDADLDPESMAMWRNTPSSFLSGERPVDVARTNPGRALLAYRRFLDA